MKSSHALEILLAAAAVTAPIVTAYLAMNKNQTQSEYEYIIVGSGTGGGTLACVHIYTRLMCKNNN
jgi:hypothetical protein